MQAVPTLPMTVPTQEGVGWTWAPPWLGQPRQRSGTAPRLVPEPVGVPHGQKRSETGRGGVGCGRVSPMCPLA